jgi:transcriptional regulator with GAF, ATPase, and Fis domain
MADPATRASPDAERVLESLREFAAEVAREGRRNDLLRDLAVRLRSLLGVDGTIVSILHSNRLVSEAADGYQVPSLERLVDSKLGGPTTDAATVGRDVAVEDISTRAGDWPTYAAAAERAGVAAVAAIPIMANKVLGVLTLVSTSPRPWIDFELKATGVFAQVAAGYLVRANERLGDNQKIQQLEEALESRVLIEQAKGVLMATRGIGADEAFAMLRKHANDHRVSLRHTAESVVTMGLRL